MSRLCDCQWVETIILIRSVGTPSILSPVSQCWSKINNNKQHDRQPRSLPVSKRFKRQLTLLLTTVWYGFKFLSKPVLHFAITTSWKVVPAFHILFCNKLVLTNPPVDYQLFETNSRVVFYCRLDRLITALINFWKALHRKQIAQTYLFGVFV